MGDIKELVKQILYGSYIPGIQDVELIERIEPLQADKERLEVELADSKELAESKGEYLRKYMTTANEVGNKWIKGKQRIEQLEAALNEIEQALNGDKDDT